MPTYKEIQEEKRIREFQKEVEEQEKLVYKLRKEEMEAKMAWRKDFIRRLQLERREASLNGIVLKAQEVATLQKNQLEQEEKLAAEMDLIRRKELVDEKLRLHLRENSHELKDLEAQLRMAYVNKAIAAQLAEKEAYKIEEQIRERRAREVMEKAMGTLVEQEEALRFKEKKRQTEFRQSLQDQIIEKEALRQQEYLSFMKERKVFDDIIKRIKDEDEKEMIEKNFMKEKLREEMEQFNVARQMWKAKERYYIQQEEEKIKQINEEKARFNLKNMNEKNTHQELVNMVYEKVYKEIHSRQKQKEEREELISTIIWSEQEEKNKREIEEEKQREIRRREEARSAYVQMLEEKNRKKREEKELEAQFARQMNLKLEEDEKKERDREEQRRLAQINNRKYNEEAMKQNIQKRAESLKLNQLINELEEKEEMRKAKLVEEERMKMLREHGPKLMGYLPKPILKTYEGLKLEPSESCPFQESCPLEKRKP